MAAGEVIGSGSPCGTKRDAHRKRRNGSQQAGGHPTGDPFGIVVALVENDADDHRGNCGQFVTCGSFTGLRYFRPGDVCEVRLKSLAQRQLTFSP